MKSLSEHRVLLATDLPFWNKADGAQQRIAQLADQLLKRKIDVQVFYLGLEAPNAAARDLNIQIEHATPHEPPQQFGPKLKWYWDSVLNQIRSTSTSSSPSTAAASLQLSDFVWPWARQKFAEAFQRIRPTCVIVEYVKLAYLLEGLSPIERQSCMCCLDSHDILHLRNKQFRNRGLDHWIDISKKEEINALARFDHVFAIQKSEAEAFQSELKKRPETNTQVHVVGYAAEHFDDAATVMHHFVAKNEAPTFGYLGSSNDSNLDAANWLIAAWPEITSKLSQARLILAGSICNALDCDELAGVNLLGRVDEVQTFYRSVDICLNPVRFGTGLKIKNVEALAYGRPLVTTTDGWDGLPEPPPSERPAVSVSRDEAEFVRSAVSMGQDRVGFPYRVETVLFFARKEFSAEQAYSQLWSVLETHNR